ncbi:MAG TPA: retroviral-like aspartic protease family protein [Sphingomicrobium sp.]|nr:retroviral-like aspartic protease family protein [Sphingomicrobium sp.]
MLVSHWVAAGIVLAAVPVAAEQQPSVPAASPAQAIDTTTVTDEIALGRDLGDRMTVAVSVAGQGPYRFLVDTGSERTVISRQLANRLRLDGGQGAILHSVFGVTGIDTVHIPDLRVSGSKMSVANAPALDASHIGADGMLGTDSLRSQRVLFDFKAQTMSITPSSQRPERLDGDTIVVRAKSRRGRLIFTQARVDGHKVTVIVDTGSQMTIGNLALQKKLARRNIWAGQGPVEIETVTGEKFNTRLADLDEVELGGVKLDDMAVVFADAHIFRQLGLKDKPALLLGMNAMRAFDRISIDFRTRKVRFVLPGTSMRQNVRLAGIGGI